MKYIMHYDSPIGPITLASDGQALTDLLFDGEKYYDEAFENHSKGVKENNSATKQRAHEKCIQLIEVSVSEIADHPAFAETIRWLDIYFSGKDPGFLPPLKLQTTPFRQEICKIMLTIPYGATMTYGQIADIIAKRRGIARMSAQAVGGAVGHNPISLIIPCHRVIGTDGSLVGYGGGVDKKLSLLQLEGADMTNLFVPFKGTAL